MVQLKTIRKFKCAISICGIFAFAIVFGCDLFCDLGLISFSPPGVIFAAHNHEDHSSNDHQGGKQQPGNHQHSVVGNHLDQSSDEEGCCDDLTQRFYFSLSTTGLSYVALVHVQLLMVLSSLFFNLAPVVFTTINLRHTEFQHLPNGPPGMNGNMLRVLISSFLI